MRVRLAVIGIIFCCAVTDAQYFRVDPDFTVEINAPVRGVGVQLDGKIIIAGDFTNVAGFFRPHVARLNFDGTVDASFVPVEDAAFHGGQVIVTASNIYAGPQRYDLNGNWDATYPAGAGYVIDSKRRQIYGVVTDYRPKRMWRWNPDGSLDASFSPLIDYDVNLRGVNAVGIQWDAGAEKILIGGKFVDVNGSYYPGLARLNEDGSTDTNFLGHIMETPTVALAVWRDGKFYTATDATYIRRHLPDGRVDASFATASLAGSSVDEIRQLVPAEDGKLLVLLERCIGECRSLVLCFNSDGTRDTGFSLLADSLVVALAHQPDGAVLISGFFTNVNCIRRTYLARLIPSDTRDPLPCIPPPPLELSVTRIRGEGMVCCWPTNYPEYTLQATKRLRPRQPEKEKWVTVTNTPVVGESTVCVTNRIARWGRHYRLIKL